MKKNQRLLVALILAILTACGLAYLAYSYSAASLPDDVGVLLEEARKAKFTHDLKRERRLLEHAENLEGPAEDLAEVQRLLALLDWKHLGKFEAARDRLIRAAEGAEPADAWLAMARMEQAREAFPAAREAAVRAADRAATEEQTDDRGSPSHGHRWGKRSISGSAAGLPTAITCGWPLMRWTRKLSKKRVSSSRPGSSSRPPCCSTAAKPPYWLGGPISMPPRANRCPTPWRVPANGC